MRNTSVKWGFLLFTIYKAYRLDNTVWYLATQRQGFPPNKQTVSPEFISVCFDSPGVQLHRLGTRGPRGFQASEVQRVDGKIIHVSNSCCCVFNLESSSPLSCMSIPMPLSLYPDLSCSPHCLVEVTAVSGVLDDKCIHRYVCRPYCTYL